MTDIRKDFPILNTRINGKPLIYLDNAATMQMPEPVQRRMQVFYAEENANIHRGIHMLSENATVQYERVRELVCRFLQGAPEDGVVFTAGTTDSINLVAEMLEETLCPGDEIITTQMEHHSNFIPWQQLCKRRGLRLRVVPVDGTGRIDLEQLAALCSERVKLAAFTELSNVTGVENPVEQMIGIIRSRSRARILLDGAQGVVHCGRRLSETDCDFYCFSGHKLGAPTGTGVLYVKAPAFSELRPARFGGGTVHSVTLDEVAFTQGAAAFEPGTPNYAGVIGLGAALEYWMEHRSTEGEAQLLRQLEQGLGSIDGVRILGETQNRKGCVSISINGVHPYDFCKFLDMNGIAARSGHLCAMPYLNALQIEYAIRFSLAPYNTADEIGQVLKRCEGIVPRLRSLGASRTLY